MRRFFFGLVYIEEIQIFGMNIEDIYFFEVNTKYISSSAVKKISIFQECVARVKMLIFHRTR